MTGLAGKPLKAALLDGGKHLKFMARANDVTIEVPAEPKNPIATVIALDLAPSPAGSPNQK